MDAFASSPAQLKSINQTSEYKVPSEIRILQSAIDVSFLHYRSGQTADEMLTPHEAYFYNIIGLFPGNSSYNFQANTQKAQVDTHCFQAVWAFDLIGSVIRLLIKRAAEARCLVICMSIFEYHLV